MEQIKQDHDRQTQSTKFLKNKSESLLIFSLISISRKPSGWDMRDGDGVWVVCVARELERWGWPGPSNHIAPRWLGAENRGNTKIHRANYDYNCKIHHFEILRYNISTKDLSCARGYKTRKLQVSGKIFGEYNGEFEMCVRCVTIVTLGTHSGI